MTPGGLSPSQILAGASVATGPGTQSESEARKISTLGGLVENGAKGAGRCWWGTAARGTGPGG